MTAMRATPGAGSPSEASAPMAGDGQAASGWPVAGDRPVAGDGRAASAWPVAGDPDASRHRNGSTPWYLVYLGIMAFPLLFDPRTGSLSWVVTIVVAVGFAVFYLTVGRAVRGGRLHRTAPFVAAVIAVAAFPVNLGATVMLVYSAAFAGDAWPRRSAVRWLALLSLLAILPLAVGPVPLVFRIWSTLPTLIFVWVVGLETASDAQRERAHAALRVENSRIEAIATLTERERLARDVHDSIGQSLTSVIVRSQLARRLVTVDPQRAQDELAELERVARAALSDARVTVSGWRHVHLDDELALATATLAAAGVVAAVDRADVVATPEAESALALALREAVTNVVRHAGAAQVSIAVRREGAEAVVVVTDDGAGVQQRPGGGLSGMRDRLESLGGRLEVGRAVPRGTRLRASVPTTTSDDPTSTSADGRAAAPGSGR